MLSLKLLALLLGALMLSIPSVSVNAGGPPPPPPCNITTTIGNTPPLWTPIIILNSPYGGSATGESGVTVSGSYSFNFFGFYSSSSTSTTSASQVSASNGATAAIFELDVWTITKVTKSTGVLCGYSSSIYSHGGVVVADLQGSGPQNDLNVPQTFSYNGYNSIKFNVDYTTANADHTSWDTCPTSNPSKYTVTSQQTSSIGISISFSIGGTVGVSAGTFDISVSQGSQSSFEYDFPAHFGVWFMHSLLWSGQNSGIAFYYVPCNTDLYLPALATVVYGWSGGGTVSNPLGILKAPDGSYANLHAPNCCGDSAFVQSNYVAGFTGTLEIYAYSYNNHAGAYTSHVQVFTSPDGSYWTQVYDASWSPSSTNTPSWINIGLQQASFKYVKVVALDNNGYSANIYIDSIAIVPP